MSDETIYHSISFEEFYPLTQDEYNFVRKKKNKSVPVLLTIGAAIIILAAILAFGNSDNIRNGLPGFAFGVFWAGIFIVIAILKILDTPVGGRYGTIVSCHTVKETTGSGDNETTHIYYHFVVKLDDTGIILKDFVGTMHSKTIRTGSKVFVVKNKKGNPDVFLADSLIESGVYSPPPDETKEFQELVREHGGRVSNIDDLDFYDLSNEDIQAVKYFRKRYYRGVLIVFAVAAVFMILFEVFFNRYIQINFAKLIFIFGIFAASIGIIGVLIWIYLMKYIDKEYAARHVIIMNMRTESCMNLAGDSHQVVFYTFETTDTQEILNEMRLDDTGAFVKSIGTEVLLLKDQKGRYSIFNLMSNLS
ncbi:hypothetical protein [Ruminococcus flavefaciens]|uniref:hypothetical protein n=1 Tax=Ruminococcus flavefaciens TaxID=1265 RepID=UPI00048E9F07|nr:hypothetical protein [Ruminococcus flavefaciens]